MKMRSGSLLPQAQVRSLSRLRGRVGVGVSPRTTVPELSEPPPAALSERLSRSIASAFLRDGRRRRPMLPRKRERYTECLARVNPS
jgi:hypothetical protein